MMKRVVTFTSQEPPEMRRAVRCTPALVATLLIAGQAAFAQPAASPPGRLLASNCFQCHGTNGKGKTFEKLAGKSADKLFKELKEQQSGKEGEGIMARHAQGYTDAQLRALTRWLAAQR